jgi:DNA-binding MarR family transcriptional regulator
MTVRNNTEKEENSRNGKELRELISVDSIIISFFFWQAYKTYVAGFEKALRPWDINPSQCLTLWFLRYFDTPLTASRIAALLALETHSVTSLLDGLQKRGLIKRRRSKTDRRVIEVIITDEGKLILTKVRGPYLEFVNGMFKGQLSDAELNTFTDVLRHMWDAGMALQGIDPKRARLIIDKHAAKLQAALLLYMKTVGIEQPSKLKLGP